MAISPIVVDISLKTTNVTVANPSGRCWDITVKLRLSLALDEKSGDHQSHWDLSFVTMDIYTKFHANPSSSCWDILFWTKKQRWTDRSTNYAIPSNTQTVPLQTYLNESGGCIWKMFGLNVNKRWLIWVFLLLVELVPMAVASVVLQSVDGTETELKIRGGEDLSPVLLNPTLCANVVLKVSQPDSNTVWREVPIILD